jgi:hypothetical protein
MKSAITKRYNNLKTVSKYWSESDFSSTINALTLMKDITVSNDFFTNAFIRDDINIIPLTLDHAIGLIPHVKNLVSSRYDTYNKTGCKTGIILLKLMSEKIFNLRSNSYINNEKEEQIQKCEKIIDHFGSIFKSGSLNKYRTNIANPELSKLASSLYTDLEFFLKSLKKI